MLTRTVGGGVSLEWVATKVGYSRKFGRKVDLRSGGKGEKAGTEKPTVDDDGVPHPQPRDFALSLTSLIAQVSNQFCLFPFFLNGKIFNFQNISYFN